MLFNTDLVLLKLTEGNSLEVQRLGLHALSSGAMGLLAGQGTKIQQSGINKNLDLSRFRMPQPSSG